MGIFTVYERYSRRVVLETDDWVEAEVRSSPQYWPAHNLPLSIRGTHPSHDWDEQRPRRCHCGAWDNTSFSSHAPCGYDTGSEAIVTILERELAARETAASSQERRDSDG